MPNNGSPEFDFDDFILDEDVDPLQIFRNRAESEPESETEGTLPADGIYFEDDSAPVFSDEPMMGSASPAEEKPASMPDPGVERLFNAMQRKNTPSPQEQAPSAPVIQPSESEDSGHGFRDFLAEALQKSAPPAVQEVDTPPLAIQRERVPVTIGKTLNPDEMLVYDSELDDLGYDGEDDLPEIRDYLPIRFRRTGRVGIGGGLLYALFVLSVSIVLAVVGWMFASDVLALNKAESEAVVVIDEYAPEGDDPVVNDEGQEIQVDIDQVAAALKNAGIIEYKWLFKLYSSFSHAEAKIDPGTYDVSTNLDYRALVTALQFGSGNQEVTRITFPEGYTMDQIFELLEENGICRKSELYEAAAEYDFDYDFLDDVELGDASRLEGYLFPDTYDFYQGESATVAIARFLNNTDSKLSDEVYAKASSMGYSVRDILIIASIIEKEAADDSERATVAGVIFNRLNSGMQLQLDSTIHYMLTSLGRDSETITYDDLEIDSPYNTYLYYGLPAGPICNPGLASIEAALNPENNSYLYFYAYEGKNYFFSSLDEFEAFSANPYTTETDTDMESDEEITGE